jgi:hypothetical protein
MAAEIRKMELLPNVESAHEPRQLDRVQGRGRNGLSFTTVTHQCPAGADAVALRSEARSLFVRFAVRWCRARSLDQGRKEAA